MSPFTLLSRLTLAALMIVAFAGSAIASDATTTPEPEPYNYFSVLDKRVFDSDYQPYKDSVDAFEKSAAFKGVTGFTSNAFKAILNDDGFLNTVEAVKALNLNSFDALEEGAEIGDTTEVEAVAADLGIDDAKVDTVEDYNNTIAAINARYAALKNAAASSGLSAYNNADFTGADLNDLTYVVADNRNRIDDLEDDVEENAEAISIVGAFANIPDPMEGRSSVGMGTAFVNGETGIALGVGHNFILDDKGAYSLSLTAKGGMSGDTYAVGAGAALNF